MVQNELNLQSMINNESRALIMMQQGAELALQLHNDMAKDFIAMQEEIERLSILLARAEQTVADLAAQTESSEITISRFCKKLGCSGLKELKLMLAAGMSQRRPKLFTISMPVTAAVTSPLRSLPIFPKGCRIR